MPMQNSEADYKSEFQKCNQSISSAQTYLQVEGRIPMLDFEI